MELYDISLANSQINILSMYMYTYAKKGRGTPLPQPPSLTLNSFSLGPKKLSLLESIKRQIAPL